MFRPGLDGAASRSRPHGGIDAFGQVEQPEIPFNAVLWGMTAAAAFELLWLMWMTMELPEPARPLGLRITPVDVVLGPLLYGSIVLRWWAIVVRLLPLYIDLEEDTVDALPSRFDDVPESQLI